MNAWQFACDWYNPEQIHRAITRQGAFGEVPKIPADVHSRLPSHWRTRHGLRR